MNETAAADAERGRRAAAPPQLDAAADDIGGVRSRRDVEQQAREDKKPEFVNAERLGHHGLQIFSPASFPANPLQTSAHRPLPILHDCFIYYAPIRLSSIAAYLYKHWNRSSRPRSGICQFWSLDGDMERRLAAIVCADVAGYSRMMGADEAGTHATFKAHRSAIYPIILNHGGRLVKNTGDGFLLEFPSIVGAIEAAVAMQGLMAERNLHLPADRIMQFRMGIHMGDVMADEDEVFGDDVNIAVRLESVAAPGGVAVSGKAYHEAGKRLSVTLFDAGPTGSRTSRKPIHVWTWKPAGSDTGQAPERNIGRGIASGEPSIGRRSWACCRSPISVTAPTNIFPTG